MPRRSNSNATRTEPGTGATAGAVPDLAGFESFDTPFTGTDTPGPGAGAGADTPGPETTAPGPTVTEIKRRGRPQGSKNTPGKTGKESLSSVSKTQDTLLMVHKVAAKLLAAPEVELTNDDAKSLAESITEVVAFYPRARINPKVMAWGSLIVNAFGIYSIIFTALLMRWQRDAQKRRLTVMASNPAPAAPPVNTPAPAKSTAQSGPTVSGITVPSQFHPAPPVGDYDQ